MRKKQKLIAIVLCIIIVAYISYAIYLLIVNPKDTYIIKQGTLSNEDETVGYIIRNEQVITDETHDNGIYAIVPEGQKVSKNENVFRYYNDGEKEITEKIIELNGKIQELLENEKIVPTADIKVIENQIDEKIKNINTLNNYQEILECKNDIDSLISKKINFIGNITQNQEIKNLINERTQYENTLTNGSQYMQATMSGVVSYRVDGLEDKLSPENFSQITEEYLDSLGLKTSQIISTSTDSAKIIDNFECYIAVSLNTENALNAKVGDNVQLRISNKDEYDAQIVQINEGSGSRTIIFKTDKLTQGLITHRKVEVDVIWWNKSGLKVPIEALIEENGLYYVIRNRMGNQAKILVKVEYKTDNFAIIGSYSAEELQELGYDEKEIRNYKKISNYDEIIIESKK